MNHREKALLKLLRLLAQGGSEFDEIGVEDWKNLKMYGTYMRNRGMKAKDIMIFSSYEPGQMWVRFKEDRDPGVIGLVGIVNSAAGGL
ncbi:MAG TPA: hypothetical protein VN736_00450 [Candidatus Limnocylindrales bacterium]|nr:hypothetical protein [Candidatus Limnocylindrales bacterium]